ncbi:MAG TPA: sugar ABC transporter ATP-binding protein [Firmicutes bacterium]|nr:sugar ABC transporter ATP-binding protein [Bacillota bacterium]
MQPGDGLKKEPVLVMRGISKAFPGVQALDDVEFEVFPGEILCLVGENGAGKSTLMKVLSGVHARDSGTIIFKGREVDFKTPQQAIQSGITMIYQEFNLAPNLTVAANIFLGKELTKGRLHTIDNASMAQKTGALLSRLGVRVSPDALVKDLSVAEQQMVEIAKALSQDAKLIIMDEPTATLTSRETEILFQTIRRLRDQGIAIVFVSHRLEEVFMIGDRIIVMRDGKRVGELIPSKSSIGDVVKLMVGRPLKEFPKQEARISGTVLEVRHITTDRIKDVSFTLRKGEILGFAGLVGAGRTELIRAIFGIDRKIAGEIYIEGRKVDIRSPKDAVASGLGLVPEDRKSQGLVLQMAVRENISLAGVERNARSFSRLNWQWERQAAREFIEKLRIQTPGPEQITANLSGGNQQKVVLAKWLTLHPKVLILDEPTRGIDVGAKTEVHSLISRLAQEGLGIILISSELPEILGMSDRIMVMSNGRIVAEFPREEATQEKIMACAI